MIVHMSTLHQIPEWNPPEINLPNAISNTRHFYKLQFSFSHTSCYHAITGIQKISSLGEVHTSSELAYNQNMSDIPILQTFMFKIRKHLSIQISLVINGYLAGNKHNKLFMLQLKQVYFQQFFL